MALAIGRLSKRRMFAIQFTPEAVEDLRPYAKRDRRRILEQITVCLQHEPQKETRNNKRLRPNRLGERELRVDRFRVFYDLDQQRAQVTILAVGFKRGSRLYVRGEEFAL